MISCRIKPDSNNWDLILPFVTYTLQFKVLPDFYHFFLFMPATPFCSGLLFLLLPVICNRQGAGSFCFPARAFSHLARLSTESCQNDLKSRYDEAHRDVSFQLEDEALVSTPLHVPGLCERRMLRLIGPCKVLQRTSSADYLVVSPTTSGAALGFCTCNT